MVKEVLSIEYTLDYTFTLWKGVWNLNITHFKCAKIIKQIWGKALYQYIHTYLSSVAVNDDSNNLFTCIILHAENVIFDQKFKPLYVILSLRRLSLWNNVLKSFIPCSLNVFLQLNKNAAFGCKFKMALGGEGNLNTSPPTMFSCMWAKSH